MALHKGKNFREIPVQGKSGKVYLSTITFSNQHAQVAIYFD